MKKNSSCSIQKKTSIGGQALMEGIMMRGPKMTALAVRNTKGEIVTEEFETKGANRPKICKLPIIRGVFGYIDSMVVGYKCLMRSAELSGLEDIVETKEEAKNKKIKTTETNEENIVEENVDKTEETTTEEENDTQQDTKIPTEEKKEEKMPRWIMTLLTIGSVILGFALAIGLFVYAPTKLFQLITKGIPYLADSGSAILNSLYKSVFEGIIKIVLLVGYMLAISLMKDIRRTYMYHGAEHKTIFCYESGLPLTVDNVKKMRRFHPRCGTSFLILMLLVSIFISFFIDPICIAISGEVLPIAWRVLLKLALIPLIVGIGYELIKFAGRHDNLLTRIISAPGVWLQHVTVFEPTDDMIECAITAVNAVIPQDDSDKW